MKSDNEGEELKKRKNLLTSEELKILENDLYQTAEFSEIRDNYHKKGVF